MTTRTRYHHGNLRAALTQAGLELAREGGPEAVAVREASRRAGVSHNAAYRHFPSRDAFLKAVCDQCMNELASLMEELIAIEERTAEVDPSDMSVEAIRLRLRATGAAYVQFALSEPGLFQTAFSVPTGMSYAGGGSAAGDGNSTGDGSAEDPPPRLGPFGLLGKQLDDLVAAGGLTPARRANADFAAWSAVHGLSMLLLAGPLRELPDAKRDAVLERIQEIFERGV